MSVDDSTIIEKLGSIEKNIATLLERTEQTNNQHLKRFEYVEKDLEKANEGRKVLHQKTDDIERRVVNLEKDPDIIKLRSIFNNSGKIIWGLVGLGVTGILLSSLPKIIELLS